MELHLLMSIAITN